MDVTGASVPPGGVVLPVGNPPGGGARALGPRDSRTANRRQVDIFLIQLYYSTLRK